MTDIEATALPRQRWQNLIAAIACVTVFGFALGQMFPLLSLIMEREGVPPDVIGYNTSMQPVGILLSGFVVPPLVHRFGAKPVVVMAAFSAAAIVLCYPVLPIFWAWFGLRVLQGLAVSTLFSISEAWVVHFAQGPYRARIVGIYASVLALSFGLGSYTVAVLGTEGFLPFAVGAAVLILATFPVLLVREDAMPDEEGDGAVSFFAFVPKAPVLLLAVGVFAVFRPKDSPQDAIYHDTNMTEILYILRGSANLITGGTIPDARPPQRPGGNYTGTKIDGGSKRHVVPGDVIITPGRTPHLWADIESDMSYLVFRPDPENTLPLK